MENNLNDILVFTRVMERGGIRAAAEALGQPKSNVSRSIAALEARLGVRLLERNTRSVRPTEAGELYYSHCRRILMDLDQATALVQSRQDSATGVLRVTTALVLAKYFLGDVISRFLSQNPGIRIFADITNRPVDMVEDGYDLAFRIGPVENSSLVSRRIGTPGAGLYASRAYLQGKAPIEHPHDLSQHRTLSLSPLVSHPAWHLSRLGERATMALSPVLNTNDTSILLQAAMDGNGICAAPHFVCAAEGLRDVLVPVLPEWAHDEMEIRALYPSHKSVSPLIRAFLDFAVERADAVFPLKPAA